jgi:hypothetical protein
VLQSSHGAQLAVCSVFPAGFVPSLFPLFLFFCQTLAVGGQAEFEPTTPWSKNNKAWRRAPKAIGIPNRHIDDVRDAFGKHLAQVLEETIAGIRKRVRPVITVFDAVVQVSELVKMLNQIADSKSRRNEARRLLRAKLVVRKVPIKNDKWLDA